MASVFATFFRFVPSTYPKFDCDKDPAVFKVLAKRLYGKLFADKGYISQKLFDLLFPDFITFLRHNIAHIENLRIPVIPVHQFR